MTVHTTAAPLARQPHRWLILGATVLAMVAVAAVLTITIGNSGTTAPPPQASPSPASSFSIMSLTPAQLAANALGTGYALPSVQKGLTVASVLASLSPSTRRHIEAIMSLTFAQLKAGAAGSP